MTDSVRRIGLSLGADLCWPAAYEALINELDLAIPLDGETVRFEVDRVTVEPFDLRYRPRYDLVLDRLTHWYSISREWVKKIVLMDGVYVPNNPWAIQSMEKHTTYCAMIRLGLPIPDTWMIPAKDYDRDEWDTGVTVDRYNRLFDLSKVGDAVGYPSFLKPYDGGGWVGVRKVDDHTDLHGAYDKSGRRVHHLQAGVKDWDLFVRGLGIGPQVNLIRYDPSKPLHGRYVVDFNYLTGEEWLRATRITRTINSFFNWDFNSCEMLRAAETLHPIDFANACPDSQVTSLHYHFPWVVKALVKWTLFCAATRRKMRLSFDWDPYFEIADTDAPLDDKLAAYDALAKKHFDADAFEQFCDAHLSHLDEVAVDYFGTPAFEEVVRAKVSALYPPHEVERFTEHFYGMVQFWRKTETDRLGAE